MKRLRRSGKKAKSGKQRTTRVSLGRQILRQRWAGLNKTGRPPKYKPEFVAVARQMCRLGATDADLARAFEVTTQSISMWKHQYPDFLDALQLGAKDLVDAQVERSFYERATGYSYDAEKITVDAKTGLVTRTPYREHVPPDVTAQQVWLRNRKPEEWRNKAVDDNDNGPVEIEQKTALRLLMGKLEGIASRLPRDAGGNVLLIEAESMTSRKRSSGSVDD